jgi:hypothetical protein
MSESNPEIKMTENSINEFYKLKSKYESDIIKNKKKIINNTSLSLNEKRREFNKLVPKCINCKKPGGTIFSIKYNKDEDSRVLKAICGVTANPCNLNISISIGQYYLFPDILKDFETDIANLKHSVIQDKNKILFGYIPTERALANFTYWKERINDETTVFQSYFEEYMKIVDNKEKNQLIVKEIELVFGFIDSIKASIKMFDDTNNTQYVNDAVNIYLNSLKPSADKLINLKYNENVVWYDEDTNEYKLMQNKYTIRDIEFNTGEEKVVKFDIGFVKSEGKKSKPKPIKPVKPVKSMPAPTPTKPNPTVIIESTTTPSSLYEDLGLDKLAAALL